jgi:peptide methionine sulfoxide reductase MsrA
LRFKGRSGKSYVKNPLWIPQNVEEFFRISDPISGRTQFQGSLTAFSSLIFPKAKKDCQIDFLKANSTKISCPQSKRFESHTSPGQKGLSRKKILQI